jgi:hypothetical protein
VRVALAIVLIIAGCNAPSAPRESTTPHLVVPAPEYAVRVEGEYYRAEIPFRYTNRTSGTVVLTGCRPPSSPMLEWWDGTQWRLAFQHVELMCLSAPFVIPRATVIDDTVRLQVARDSIGSSGRLTLPYWDASHDVGDYRLVWRLQDPGTPGEESEMQGGRMRPLAERVSNTFRLTIALP